MAANILTLREEYYKFSKCYISFLLRCEGFLLDREQKFGEEFTKPISVGLVITARELKHLFDQKIESNCDTYARDFDSLSCYICNFAVGLNREGITDWAPIMAVMVFCGELVLRIVRAGKYQWINVIIEILAQMLSLYHNIIVHFGGLKGLHSYCSRTFIGPEETTTEAETAQEPGPSGIAQEPGPSGIAQEPGPSGIAQEPGPSGIAQEPGPSGIAQEPGPSGIAQEPGPSGIAQEPGPSGIAQEPGPSGIAQEPGPSGIAQEPGPSGIAQEPGPSGIKKKPLQHASKSSKEKSKASKNKTK